MGELIDIPEEEYFARKAYSNSMGNTLLAKSPLHAITPQPEKTPTHLEIGKAIHTAVLEPGHFESRFWHGPEDRRGNKWKDAKEQAAVAGKTALVDSDWQMCQMIRDRVTEDTKVSQLIGGNDALVERSGFWDAGIPCKARYDLLRPSLGVCLDLKTSADASPAGFPKSVYNYGYHRQAAHYLDGLRYLEQPITRFIFLALEKEPPYAFALYELDEESLELGQIETYRAQKIYRECLKSGEVPGYPSGVNTISLPRWAFQKKELKG